LYGIGGHPIKLDGVTLHKEFAKLHIGVVQGMLAELISLHKGDNGGAELEVVGLHRRTNNE